MALGRPATGEKKLDCFKGGNTKKAGGFLWHI